MIMRLCRLVFAMAVGLLGLAAAGCTGVGSPFDTPAPPSGIRGTVILGPTCSTGEAPGAHEPVPCLTPYAAQVAVLNGEGAVITRTTSGADGRFEVTLPPGEYIVTPEGGDPYPIAQPVSVSVGVGEYVEIQVNYDTGIR
ncbi:hypothetical protein BH23CHL6_BH23CHL6_05530 [soil metagenome]